MTCGRGCASLPVLVCTLLSHVPSCLASGAMRARQACSFLPALRCSAPPCPAWFGGAEVTEAMEGEPGTLNIILGKALQVWNQTL